jgi:PAS domain S-box-containing protein
MRDESAGNDEEHLHGSAAPAGTAAPAAVFDVLLDAVLITDADARITAWNASAERMFGYSKDEALGRTPELFHHPALGGRVEAEILVALRRSGRWTGEIPFRRKDGSDGVAEAVVTALYDAEGRRTAHVGVNRDITERKRGEVRLAAAEAHYRRLVENSPYAIYALDRRGRFTEANAAVERILGRSAAELIGNDFRTVVAPEHVERVEALFHTRLDGVRDAVEHEFFVLRPSGERRLVHLSSAAIRDEQGAVWGVHGVGRDVTIERERAQQLRRAERLASIGTLVGGVAHELNNPLTTIKSFAELMLLDERAPEDREALEIIHHEAVRTGKIVADLRSLARESAGDGAADAPTLVDVNDVVRQVLRVRRYALELASVEVEEDLAPALDPVWAPPGRMGQIVLSLVLNAEQALASHAGERRLAVRTRPAGRGVALAVVDSGPGIRAEHLERIFDPFWTTHDPGSGTGLGLSLVHGIVAEQGGSVRVESERGRGAAFHVELPSHAGRARSHSA